MEYENSCPSLQQGMKPPASPIRKAYILRLVGRCIVFVICFAMCFFAPEQFDVLEGFNFFRQFSLLHLLWIIWLIDMLFQLIPAKDHIPLGSQKHLLARFKPIKEKINYAALKKYVVTTTKSAYKVFVIWVLFIGCIGALHHFGIFGDTGLFMFSVAFYVCDLICVLIWCPFRLIMKNRCCTTCRIFNWDHLMMFSPFFFLGGFYAASLLLMSIAVWLVWEFCVFLYPERFWEQTNEALRCSECTDKLCTQYCQKLRPVKKEKNK